MHLLEMLLGTTVLVLLVCLTPLVVVFTAECLAALFARRAERVHQDDGDLPAFTVLVPAHNEQVILAGTLRSLLKRLPESGRVLVIADNCDDQTAAIARQAGVDVIERHDPTRRGKGYALAFGVDHLRDDPPEVVVVVDADADVMPGMFGELVRGVVRTQRPCQALYLLRPGDVKRPQQWIATFAFRVRNQVRPIGGSLLGVGCQLMGNGMGFLWNDLANMKLASSEIAEDFKLGIDLAKAGNTPQLITTGMVQSDFPTDMGGERTQRQRWEHGHLALIRRFVPGMLWQSFRQRRLDLLLFALDLAVPPIAMLMLLLLVAVVLAALQGLLTQSYVLLAIALSLCGAVSLAVASAWVKYGRDIPPRILLTIPLYVVNKIPIYLGVLRGRDLPWIRTAR